MQFTRCWDPDHHTVADFRTPRFERDEQLVPDTGDRLALRSENLHLLQGLCIDLFAAIFVCCFPFVSISGRWDLIHVVSDGYT